MINQIYTERAEFFKQLGKEPQFLLLGIKTYMNLFLEIKKETILINNKPELKGDKEYFMEMEIVRVCKQEFLKVMRG